MQINPEHIMIFEVIDDSKFESFTIVNPVYIYKTGDIINLRYITEDPVKIETYEVVDVSQEVNIIGDGEQYITVYLKKILKH